MAIRSRKPSPSSVHCRLLGVILLANLLGDALVAWASVETSAFESAGIIAGSIEVFALAWHGVRPCSDVLLHYVVPTLIGNTVGGVTLVAALNHAHVVLGGAGEDL